MIEVLAYIGGVIGIIVTITLIVLAIILIGRPSATPAPAGAIAPTRGYPSLWTISKFVFWILVALAALALISIIYLWWTRVSIPSGTGFMPDGRGWEGFEASLPNLLFWILVLLIAVGVIGYLWKKKAWQKARFWGAIALLGIVSLCYLQRGQLPFVNRLSASASDPCSLYKKPNTPIVFGSNWDEINPYGCDLTYYVTEGTLILRRPNGSEDEVSATGNVVGRRNYAIYEAAKAAGAHAAAYVLLCPNGKAPEDGGWVCRS